MVGMPVGSGSVPWATSMSLLNTVRACDKAGVHVRIEAPVGCSIVQWTRSAIAEMFLRSDSTHLFWIDSDIVWTPDDFFRIVGSGAVLDIVGASYPFKKEPISFLINFSGGPGQAIRNGLGCLKIESMAIGFTIMKRAVIEKIAAMKPRVMDKINGLEYADLFRVDRTEENGPRGEDVAFFADAKEQGFEAWLEPKIRLGHIGMKIYQGDPVESLGLQMEKH
jgi:hypothetical protein